VRRVLAKGHAKISKEANDQISVSSLPRIRFEHCASAQVTCGKWTYWDVQLGTHYAFWGTDAFPCATAELNVATGEPMWTIYFLNFAAGPPPDAAFAMTAGVQCPAATDPSGDMAGSAAQATVAPTPQAGRGFRGASLPRLGRAVSKPGHQLARDFFH